MRFLKKKIALSAEFKAKKLSSYAQTINIVPEPKIKTQQLQKKPKGQFIINRKPKKEKQPKEEIESTKTVVKNYGKAIASFATSVIAVPYLTPLINEKNGKLSDFVEYVSKAKETIEGIDTLRSLLLPKEDDDEIVASYKNIFRKIAEIFIKYFSVNWIYSGRMINKKVHLKFRFKMLRRVKNPELFTYLK